MWCASSSFREPPQTSTGPLFPGGAARAAGRRVAAGQQRLQKLVRHSACVPDHFGQDRQRARQARIHEDRVLLLHDVLPECTVLGRRVAALASVAAASRHGSSACSSRKRTAEQDEGPSTSLSVKRAGRGRARKKAGRGAAAGRQPTTTDRAGAAAGCTFYRSACTKLLFHLL